MIKAQCDILIIGAGMGGLAAASLLSRYGYRVIVSERMARVGGRCSTMNFRGFKLTTGVIGPEMYGTIEKFFDRVGAEFDVRPAGTPHYRVRGRVVEVPAKGGLRCLISAATDDEAEVSRVMTAISRALGWVAPSRSISLRHWLLEYTRNESILGIFQAMAAATTLVNADELSAFDFFCFLKKLGGYRSFGFCPGGSISLANALVEVVKQHKGVVWEKALVTEILSENGVVKGALVKKEGEEHIEIEAKSVISNCGPRKTADLVGHSKIGQQYIRELNSKIKPAMILAIHIGADIPLLEHDYLIVTDARRINAIFQPTLVCPELSPEGRHYLLAGAAPTSSLQPLDARKEFDLCMKDLRELLPDFDKHAEILLTSTYKGDWPGMHSWPGHDMPIKTPLVNLYNVGDGVKQDGMIALVAAVYSGIQAAEEIHDRFESRR